MSIQKRPTAGIDLSRRWRALPIRSKLLLPLTIGIALALGILYLQVQTPIDSLARSNAQQTLTAQRELYQGRIASYLSNISDRMVGLTSQAPLVSFAAAAASNPGTDVKLAASSLTPFFVDQLGAANSPFYRLRYLSTAGANLVSVVGNVGGKVSGHVEDPATLPNESGRPYFQAMMALSQGKSFVLPTLIGIDGVALVEIGTPLYVNNVAVGALVGSFPAADFLNGLFSSNANDTISAVLQEGGGTVMAASDPAHKSPLILGQVDTQFYGIPTQLRDVTESNMTAINGQLYVVSHLQNVPNLPTNTWTLAISESIDIAFKDSNTLKTSVLATLLILFALGVAGAVFVSRSVSRPLAEVTRMARSLSESTASPGGEAEAHALPENRDDEIGQLASALTTMNKRLSESFGMLESRVAERTRNLEIAAQIGRDAAQLRDIDELLQRTVNAIRDRFNFYHAQVFLLDDAGEYAILVTSTGEAGRILLGRNHKLAVGSNSVVGQTTGKGRTFITLDTQKSDVPHRFNPVLPKTRSEMAVPLRAGGRIIGALDVQSVEADAFDEDDAQIFEVLADQIAIAIDNARLLDESEGRVRQIADLNRQLTRSAWDEYLQGEKGSEIGYQYDLREIKPLPADGQAPDGKPDVEEVDIKVRGQTVGSIAVKAGQEQFTDEERSILQAITERVALAIENARLVEQTQSALSRVEQLYQATRTLGKATDMSNVFEIVADQIQGFEVIDRVIVLLAGPNPVPNAEYLEVAYAWERYLLPDSPYTVSRRYVANLLAPLTSGNRRAYAMDVDNDLSGYEMLRRELTTVGTQSVSSAILATATRWFGVLVCHSSYKNAFGDNFLQFLSAISDQVAAAIENQMLIRNIQTEAARSRALADAVQVSSQMGSEFEAGIANLFRVVSGPADFDRWWFGQLVTTDAIPTLTRVTSHFDDGSPLYLLARIRLQSDQNSIAEAARLGEWVLVNDPTDHHALAGISQQHARAYGKHIAVPVLSGNQVVGALMVGRDLEKPDLDERDVQLAVALANQVAVVLENRRLFATAETERKTLQSIIDSLPTGIVVIDGNTHEITLTNSLARTLLGLDEIVPYRRVHALTGSAYREDEFPPLRALDTAAAISGEDMSIILPDGDRRELLVNAVPVTSREGNLLSAVAVFQDVTELRELETELAESLRETTSMYETSRSISSESDLPGVLKVISNQVRTSIIPTHLFAVFAKSEQAGIGQAFVIDTSGDGGVEPILGDLPIPESVLVQNDPFVEGDIASNPTLADNAQLAALGIQSIASFPFNVRAHTVGWLVVGFDNPYELTMDQRRSVTTLIDQASVAVENARLAEETAQALSETGLLYEASYNINRVSDIPQALEVIRDEIKFFAPTQIDVFLAQNEGENAAVEWAMHWNANETYLGRGASGAPAVPGDEQGETVPRISYPTLPGDFSTLLEATTQFVSDRESAIEEELAVFHALPGFEEFQAQASVPMLVAGRSTGRLVVSFNRPYNFGRLERQFISALADQAAIVINNNMLVQQTRDSLEETGTLYETSRAIADSPNLTGIMNAIIDRACPSDVTRASLFRLLTESWAAEDVTVELAASWEHDKVEEATNIRYAPQQYAAWDLISVSEVKWIEDVASDNYLSEEARQMFAERGTVSAVALPLLASGRTLGTLLLEATQTWVRTDRESRILGSLVDQASISIDNRNLLAQTDRRARQLQTSSQVAEAATTILNLQELFDKTVNLILDSFGYDHVQIFLITPDGLDAPVVASTGEAGKRLLARQHHLLVGSQSVIGRVTSTGIAQIVSDTKDPRAVHRPNPDLPDTRAEMALPMIGRNNHILGALDVQSNHPGAFTKDDVAALSGLANQIAIAIENARQFEISTRRAQEMEFLFDVTREASIAVQESQETFRNIAGMIRKNLSADATVLLVATETSEAMKGYTSLAQGAQEPAFDIAVRQRSLLQIVADHKPHIFAELPPGASDILPGMGSAIVVPLASGDELIGVIGAARIDKNGFSEDSLTLLNTLSSTLAAVIQNSRLLQQVQSANARLREVDKLKSQFLANMSHELRTPLNSIIGFSRVILKGIDGPLSDMQNQDLTTIHESGKHLLNLVNDILDQAKIEAGKMELSLGFFSISELVKSVMSTAVGLVKDKPVRLHQEIEANLPQVWGDEFRTRQVLLNLLSNAAKFTAEGNVTASVFRIHAATQEMVQISVTDSGIGIPEDKLDAIFEAFQQAEATTARQYEGTGLGLPIARSLIELQGGKIWVESEMGVGSTFSFTIPTTQPEPAKEDAHDATEANPEGAGGADITSASPLAAQVGAAMDQGDGKKSRQRLILAIDDEPGVVTMYRRFLAKAGYEVLGGKPQEAEELAIAYSPRVILLDINMPNLSGWDVLARLKDRDETFEIPVIVCSIENDKERAFRLGATDYLLKPIEEKDMVDTVRRVELERDRRKVLIIDDQPESIRLVHDAIAGDERFVILEAVGGPQGMDMVYNRWPDLIILDLRMPGMDGFAVLDQLRQTEDTGRIPVLVLTADDLTDEERARLGNAQIYRKQTVDASALLDQVVAQLTW